MATAIFFIVYAFLQPVIEISPDKPFTTHTSSNLEDSHSPKYFRLFTYGKAVEVDESIIHALKSLVEVSFVMWISSMKADVRERSEFGTTSMGGIASQNSDSILAIFGQS